MAFLVREKLFTITLYLTVGSRTKLANWSFYVLYLAVHYHQVRVWYYYPLHCLQSLSEEGVSNRIGSNNLEKLI